LLQKISLDGDAHPLPNQQTFDAVDMSGSLCFQGVQLSVEMPMVFHFHTGNMNDAPDFHFTHLVAHQHGQHFLGI
jgi:hypothetical protein